MRVRVAPTASGKKAIQVVSKRYGRLTVHKHIGTYSTPEQKALLLEKAREFITQTTGQTSLLDVLSTFKPSDVEVSENRPLFVYDLLSRIYNQLGLLNYPDVLVKDLIIARIFKPASKLETIEILAEEFGKDYALKTVYRHLKKGMDKGIKEIFQKALIKFAKDDLGDSLRLVFYDVTTLYFESAAREGLRDFGFSKDHRPLDTQVVIGLVVGRDGFPLYFDIFSGKTFEGHTFIPVIKNIKSLLQTEELVVIADAAMISKDNIEKLDQEGIGFVVGARFGNLSLHLIDSISSSLAATDGKTTTETYHTHRLICQYSSTRAAKDKSDRLKQVERAHLVISTPSRITSRLRFVKTESRKPILNIELLTKAEKLEGIKGYLTNTKLPEETIIDRYHDLWRIEHSFRITKTDLEARPVFHRLEETIKAHLIIVFAGLAISKYLEIKTGLSIKRILKIASKVLTHKVTNTKTGETAYVETSIKNPDVKEKVELLRSLGH